ncbi:hypothetical protein [Halocynthiibacter namhaensis]|uniref:hypothetical protein n=1 Tax=Halocynthiibacter namhaensis TaxID=1290553 RepID=UPI00057912DB|nr:hypothetical protein [Halocynthiibacter namhaensis]
MNHSDIALSFFVAISIAISLWLTAAPVWAVVCGYSLSGAGTLLVMGCASFIQNTKRHRNLVRFTP